MEEMKGFSIAVLSLAGLIALAAMSLSSCGTGGGDSAGMPRVSPMVNTAPRVGDTAPDFVLTYPDGRQVKLSDFRGQPVLVNFWATWCAPCRAEMPAIEAAYRRHKDRGFVVLAVNVGESASRVKSFVEQLGLTFPVALDSKGETALVYRVRAIPSSFFIDGNGVIVNRHLGSVSIQIIEDYLLWVLP